MEILFIQKRQYRCFVLNSSFILKCGCLNDVGKVSVNLLSWYFFQQTVAWRTSRDGPSLSELWPRRRIPRRVTDDDDEDDLSESGDDYSDEEDEYGSSKYEDLDIESTLIVPFSHQRLPPPGPSPLRRHIRSIPNMPKPNLYARQVAAKFIKFVRCTRSEMEESMCCRSCGLYPIDPVSATCGHTRCAEYVNVWKYTSCVGLL